MIYIKSNEHNINNFNDKVKMILRSRLEANIKYVVTTSYSAITRSSADADNRLDAFSGQSRSTNIVPFHMLHIVSYCAIVTCL